MKTHIVQQTKNINYDIRKSDNMFSFKIQGIGLDLSMMSVKYKLMKRTTNAEKTEKSSKIYNIKNFKTIRYKVTASGNMIHSIFNYKLMRPVNNLRLPKD